MKDEWTILATAALASNYILVRGLGIPPLAEGARRLGRAFEWGLAALAVTAVSAFFCTVHYFYDLEVWNSESPFRVLVIVLVAFLVWKWGQGAQEAEGGETVIPVALAVSLMVRKQGLSLLDSVLFALGAGLGMLLASVLAAGIMQKAELALIPKAFRGTPIFFVSLGILALAFRGFRAF